MHLTLKIEATKPASDNFLQRQDRFDNFIDYYNNERPHQALDMKYPAELYASSPRPYQGLGELDYPIHDWTATVESPRVYRRLFSLSQAALADSPSC